MRRFTSSSTIAVVVAMLAMAVNASTAGAAGDTNARKACLSAEAIDSGLGSSTSIDAVDREQLTTVATRLARSTSPGAKTLATKTKRAAKTKRATFASAIDEVTSWCIAHNVLVTATTPTTPRTTVPPTTTTTRPALTAEQAEFLFKSGAGTPSYDELVKNPPAAARPCTSTPRCSSTTRTPA